MKLHREQGTATLGGRVVVYTVATSPTAQKARIKVGPLGVEVVVPKSAPATRAAEFLTEQAEWVLDQLDRVERLGNIRNTAAKPDRGTVLLGGERVPIRVVPEDSRRSFATVRQTAQGLAVNVPKAAQVDVGKAVENWLRREARVRAEERVAVWSQVVKRTPNRLYIRGQRTKWGNCSKLGNLSLNWRLVMAPVGVMDAIVIHELAHLIEPTHEARFWLILRSHCPDYDLRVRWLTGHEAAIFAPLSAVG